MGDVCEEPVTYMKSSKVYEASLDGMSWDEDVMELVDDDSMEMLLMVVMMNGMSINLDGHESDIYTPSRRYGNKIRGSPTKQGYDLS